LQRLQVVFPPDEPEAPDEALTKTHLLKAAQKVLVKKK
jgi:hypothetical protein